MTLKEHINFCIKEEIDIMINTLDIVQPGEELRSYITKQIGRFNRIVNIISNYNEDGTKKDSCDMDDHICTCGRNKD